MEAVGSDLSHHPSVAGLLVQLRDVTERKTADENQARLQFAIQDAAKEWQRTFDAIESPVLVLDGNALHPAAQPRRQGPLGKDVPRDDRPRDRGARTGGAVAEVGRARAGDARRRLGASRARRATSRTGRTWDVGASLLRAVIDRVGAHHPRRPRDHGRRASPGEAPPHPHDVGDGLARRRRRARGAQSALRHLGDPRRLRGAVRQRPEYQQYVAVLRGELERLSHLMGDLLEYGKPTSLELLGGSLSRSRRRGGARLPAARRVRAGGRSQRGRRGPAARDPHGPPPAAPGLPEPARQRGAPRAAARARSSWRPSRALTDGEALDRLPRPGRGARVPAGGPARGSSSRSSRGAAAARASVSRSFSGSSRSTAAGSSPATARRAAPS